MRLIAASMAGRTGVTSAVAVTTSGSSIEVVGSDASVVVRGKLSSDLPFGSIAVSASGAAECGSESGRATEMAGNRFSALTTFSQN